MPRNVQHFSLRIVRRLNVPGSRMQAISPKQRKQQENGQTCKCTTTVASKSLNAADACGGSEKELIVLSDLVSLGQLPKRQAIAFEHAAFQATARFG